MFVGYQRTVMAVGVLIIPGMTTPAAAQDRQAAPQFIAHTIADTVSGGYHPLAVDLNRDGRPDVVWLSVGHDELVWYENPGWEPHVITGGLNRSINVAAHDLDDDGVPELVLAHEFGTTHPSSQGVLSLLTHRGDPTQPWRIQEIDRAPTTHRLRWADIDGSGRKVLIGSPLSGPAASSPDYLDDVPVYWYDPADWSRHVVTDAERGVVHGLLVKPWQDSDRDAVLSASFLGVHVNRFIDGEWIRDLVVSGDAQPWPRSGASEVELGSLGGETFVTTIEPWHGDQVVVYRASGRAWVRQVIDTIDSGHTIVAADFDGDGHDEIVTGGRGDNPSLNLYRALDGAGATWSRQVIDDGGMSPSGCVTGDIDGDTDRDLVCVGGGTTNVKWYENLTK